MNSKAIIDESEFGVNVVPLVPTRHLTEDEVDEIESLIGRAAKRDSRTYTPTSDLSINDMAAIAIGIAMVNHLGQAFDLSERQYTHLFWYYVDVLNLYRTSEVRRG